MHHILLVSNHQQDQTLFEQSTDQQHCSIALTIQDSSDLLPSLHKRSMDLVVMVLDSVKDDDLEVIRQVMAQQPLPIILFVKHGDKDRAAVATAAGVSAYVIDGLKEERIPPILAAALTRFQETQALREELLQIKVTLKDRKIIERAKGLLMEHRSCSEHEAYTALRTLAMERNKQLAVIAQGIIDSLSLLKG